MRERCQAFCLVAGRRARERSEGPEALRRVSPTLPPRAAQATAAMAPRASGLVRLLVAGVAGALPPGRTGVIADVLFSLLKARARAPGGLPRDRAPLSAPAAAAWVEGGERSRGCCTPPCLHGALGRQQHPKGVQRAVLALIA